MATLGVQGGRLALFPASAASPAAASHAEPIILRGGVRRELLPLGVRLLERAGVSRGDAFVLVVGNDRASAACMLGAMEMRGVCALLGAGRRSLLDLVCRQTGISTVVTVDAAACAVSVHTHEPEDAAPAGAQPAWLAAPEIAEGGGCVCMLTSGSVGEPKVVPCSWEHMLRQGRSTHEQLFPAGPARLVAATSIAHAFSINTLFTLFTSPFDEQSELCFAPSSEALHALLADKSAGRLTVLYGTPGTYTALARAPPRPLHVDVAYCAGTRLSLELFDAMRERFGLRLMQNYGSTEMGDMAAWGLNGRSFDDELADVARGLHRQIPHVGSLWPGVRVVVGEDQQVRVSTPWQCLGYVKGRELHRFDAQAHPTADIGALKTSSSSGDQLVWLSGRLRPSVHVQWQGERVAYAPQEIERVLMLHPSVTDALVLMQPPLSTSSSAQGPNVHARVVVVQAKETDATTETELKQWLATHGLPAVGHSLSVSFVPFLPCSPAGKLMYT